MAIRLQPGWPARRPEVRWGLREAFLCLLVAQLFSPFWAAGVFGLAGQSLDEDPTSMVLFIGANVGLWLAYVLGSIVISRHLGRGPRTDFDVGITGGWEAAEAVMTGIMLQLIALPVLYSLIGLFVDVDPGESARMIVDLVDSPLDVVLLTLAVVLVAPVVEEIFYRGVFLPALTAATGPLVGVVGSALIFALVHQQLVVIPGLTLFGLVVAWQTATKGRVGPAIVTHMAFNATTVVQLLLTSPNL